MLASACANPEDPERSKPDGGPPPTEDAGPNPHDGGLAGPTHVLQSTNLAPATEAAEAGAYRLRGRLRTSDVREGTNGDKTIRGGFVPLGR